MSYITAEEIEKMLEKAMETYNRKKFIKDELDSCVKQIKDNLGVDVNITLKDEAKKEVNQLDYSDVISVSRKIILPDKVQTIVEFKDGTVTSVTLNNEEDYDDVEKGIMWCLLKKVFKSKRGLERIIYSFEQEEM